MNITNQSVSMARFGENTGKKVAGAAGATVVAAAAARTLPELGKAHPGVEFNLADPGSHTPWLSISAGDIAGWSGAGLVIGVIVYGLMQWASGWGNSKAPKGQSSLLGGQRNMP